MKRKPQISMSGIGQIDIQKDTVGVAEPNWVWKAQDRIKWQSLEEAFASSVLV